MAAMSDSLPSSIGLVGAGRVASALGAAALAAGVRVGWVAGRTPTRVSALAGRLGCPGLPLSGARPDVGLVVVAVSDDMLEAQVDGRSQGCSMLMQP